MLRSLARRLALLILMLTLLPFAPPPLPAAAQTPLPYQCFPETGQCLEGRFLAYWQRHGGLAVFGLPLTPARWEPNPDPHAAPHQPVVWAQWFERARFEHHPANPAPYDVLLGRLGDDRLRQQGRDWFSAFPPGAPRDGCGWFSTHHTVCDLAPTGEALGFQRHYTGHGLGDPALDRLANSVALFGLPLSEPTLETNSSGHTVLTQWFERGRFEFHPANPPHSRVLLGRLGAEVFGERRPAALALTGAIALDGSPTSTGLQVFFNASGGGRLTATLQRADGQASGGPESVTVAAGQTATTLLLTAPDARARNAATAARVCLTSAAGAETCLSVPVRPPWATGSQFVGPTSTFRGVCRVSRDGFRQLLRTRAAPAVLAERDAGEYWDAIVAHRIDPLFIAAMFQHESQMGRAGVAVQTKSWGNTRAPSFGATPIGEVPGRTGTFPVWASWRDGVISTVARLNAGNWVYAGRQTIGEIFIHPSGQVWAPAGDLNSPTGYLRAMLDFMNRHQEPTGGACR